MTLHYVPFECFDTFELGRQAKAAGFVYIWAPVYFGRVRQEVRQPGGLVKVQYVIKEMLAYPGYVSVPYEEHEAFRSWAPEQFSVKMMTVYGGPANLTGPQRAHLLKPATIPIEQLREEAAVLRNLSAAAYAEQYGPPDPAPAPKPPEATGVAVGDLVEVRFGVLQGQRGRVTQIGRKEVALGLGPRIIWIKSDYLQKVAI